MPSRIVVSSALAMSSGTEYQAMGSEIAITTHSAMPASTSRMAGETRSIRKVMTMK